MSGRIRSLKPEWLEDEALLRCSSDARVASVALLLLADDHGNGRGSDLYLGAQIFPGDGLAKIREALASLVAIRYVGFYQVDGQTYFAIRNWEKHQKVDRPGKPRVPVPIAGFRESLANFPGTPATSSRLTPTPTPTPTPTASEDPDVSLAHPQMAEAASTEFDTRHEAKPPPLSDNPVILARQQVPADVAMAVFEIYQAERESKRQIGRVLTPNGVDLDNCRTLYQLCTGNMTLVRLVIRAFLSIEGAKGYWRNHRWAIRLLIEPDNFETCRGIAGEQGLKLTNKSKSATNNQQP